MDHASRASKKSPAGAFLPAGLFGGSMLFESTRSMSLVLLQNKNLSVFVYVEAFWWSEATQIRTIALWGIFGGDFIERDGFCAVFVVECNQNFFIIEINSVHEAERTRSM